MLMERAVYNLNKEIVGYMMYKQFVKDETNKEHYIGFKRVV